MHLRIVFPAENVRAHAGKTAENRNDRQRIRVHEEFFKIAQMGREMKGCRSIVDENDIAIFHFLGSGSPYGLLELQVERHPFLIRGLYCGPQYAAAMGTQNHPRRPQA